MARWLVLVVAMASGCGEDASVEALPCGAGSLVLSDGRCQPAGLPLDLACPPGTSGDGCVPAGVPPDGCGEGMVHDGDGRCSPVLPDGPCPPGQIALPGETACRALADCGSGSWGNIPFEGGAQFVDAGAAAGGDGSQEAPWTTIQAAIDAAAPGGLVAIAAGSYSENLTIAGKAVRLWGVCPERVDIVAAGGTVAALTVLPGADGSEVRSLALRGPTSGVYLSGASLALEAVWIHDNGARGIFSEQLARQTSLTVRDSLLEGNGQFGAIVTGGALDMSTSVVRDTVGTAIDIESGASAVISRSVLERNHLDGIDVLGASATIEACVIRDAASGLTFGRGISALSLGGVAAQVSVTASVISNVREIGLYAFGSELTVDTTVSRGTLVSAGDGAGAGLLALPDEAAGLRARVTVSRSSFDANQWIGVLAAGSELTLDASAVRDTVGVSGVSAGTGVVVQDGTSGMAATASITGSVIERSRVAGVDITAADVTIERTVVRDVVPDHEGLYGYGIGCESLGNGEGRCRLEVSASLIERVHDSAIGIGAADLTVESSVLRDVVPASQPLAYGIGAHPTLDIDGPLVTVRSTRIERTVAAGMVVQGGELLLEHSAIVGTAANAAGELGDGVIIAASFGGVLYPALATIRGSRIENSARAAVSTFGGTMAVGTSAFACQQFDLDAEPGVGVSGSFEDLGGNACGCPPVDGACRVVSANLTPPEEL